MKRAITPLRDKRKKYRKAFVFHACSPIIYCVFKSETLITNFTVGYFAVLWLAGKYNAGIHHIV